MKVGTNVVLVRPSRLSPGWLPVADPAHHVPHAAAGVATALLLEVLRLLQGTHTHTYIYTHTQYIHTPRQHTHT